jgi:hypothetical protein
MCRPLPRFEPGTLFGYYLVLKFSHKGKYGHSFYICRCLGCGAEKFVDGNNLKRGQSKSCSKCSYKLKKSNSAMVEVDGRELPLKQVYEQSENPLPYATIYRRNRCGSSPEDILSPERLPHFKKPNSTGFRGVSARQGRYCAQIVKSGRIFVGSLRST